MSESNEFESAVEAVRSLGDSPDARIDQSTLLELYALYKQSTSGDCNTSQPSRFSVAAFAKWKAWDGLKGKSSEQCKKQYVDKVMNVLEKIVVELQAKNSQVPNAVLEFIDKRKTKSKVLVQKKEEYKEMKQDEKDVSESDQLIIVENIQHKNIKSMAFFEYEIGLILCF
jgi:acyl-CoA-binding protein